MLVLPAAGQDQLGRVADVRPEATSVFGADRMTLIRGSALREGETIFTGDNGEVQVVFSDETHLVIGAGSRLIIERYLMRGGDQPQKFAINALAGTFRFITGKGDKNAYSIATPTGTMGVRGTEFDFTVDGPSGQTSVILFEGGVRLCPTAGECVELTQRCEVAQLKSRREAKLLGKEAERVKVASTLFPYVSSQARLMRDFRVDRPARCAGAPKVADAKAPRKVAEVPPVIPPPDNPPPVIPPPDDPPPVIPPKKGKDNNGYGNGGEGAEGASEQGNPGKGNKGGKDKGGKGDKGKGKGKKK
jgi:hypothetical protein